MVRARVAGSAFGKATVAIMMPVHQWHAAKRARHHFVAMRVGQDMFGDQLLTFLKRLRRAVFPQDAQLVLVCVVPDPGDGFPLQAVLSQKSHYFRSPDAFHIGKIAAQRGIAGKAQFGEIHAGGRHRGIRSSSVSKGSRP